MITEIQKARFVLWRSSDTLSRDRVVEAHTSQLLAKYDKSVREWRDGLSTYSIEEVPAVILHRADLLDRGKPGYA